MPKSDILKLIKARQTVRQYTDKPLSRNVLEKILEAGIWSSSVHGFQPWKFIVITDKDVIREISGLVERKSKGLYAGYNLVLKSTAETVSNATALIGIFNNEKLKKMMRRMGRQYESCAKLTEVQAIAASIQNMVLAAQSLGVGSCWLTMPLFCAKEIKKTLNTDNEFVAFLSLGYPEQKAARAQRRICLNDVFPNGR